MTRARWRAARPFRARFSRGADRAWPWAGRADRGQPSKPLFSAHWAQGCILARSARTRLRDKGMEGIDAHQTDRATRAVEEAEDTLAEMADAIRGAGDRELVDRVARFCRHDPPVVPRRAGRSAPAERGAAVSGRVFDRRARRDGEIRRFYARGPRRAGARRLRGASGRSGKPVRLRRAALLEDNRTELDIEIEVLRERLDREGLRRAPERTASRNVTKEREPMSDVIRSKAEGLTKEIDEIAATRWRSRKRAMSPWTMPHA